MDNIFKEKNLSGFIEVSNRTPVLSNETDNNVEQKIRELEKLNEHLQQLVDLHSKELNELSSTNRKFISIIAHDLKSSFNSILGFLVLLKTDLNNHNLNNVENYVNQIYDSTHNTYQLLNSLLEWAISQNRKMTFVPTKIKLFDLITAEFENQRDIARQKKITLSHNVPQSLDIKADVHMVSAIFRNLINNALKYTNIGGKISIRVTKAGQYIVVSIKDNGIGISHENKEKLFKIENYHATVGTNNEKGTGFGLFICKEFIEIQGGNIWVESKIGKGTEFKFSLPAYF
jgi:signal transduction histidine kinase